MHPIHEYGLRETRRQFIGTAAVAATAVAGDKSLPTRALGRTGENPSILALGCGSRLLSYKEAEPAVEVVNMALDSGVTEWLITSTARSYIWVQFTVGSTSSLILRAR